MNPEYQEQARRLEELRRSVAAQSKQQSAVPLNPTLEIQSGESSSEVPDQNGLSAVTAITRSTAGIDEQPLRDPLIYPDIYAPSGFDMLGILIRVRTRPNPTIDIGNIDSGVSLVLCDSDLPDTPIVYCSEPFESLTGYCNAEILGRNCRFLQHPPQSPQSPHPPQSPTTQPPPLPTYHETKDVNAAAKSEIRGKLTKGEETQVRLVNYKKNGQVFINLLTTIPISWDGEREKDRVRKRYIVGFQVDAERHF